MLQFISKLSTKEKKIFYVAVIFVVLALLDLLFFRPAVEKLKTIDEEIERQRVEIERDLRFLSYKDRIIQESAMYQEYFQEEKKEDNVVKTEFLSAIEQLATRSKVSLIKSNPSDIIKKKKYTEYYVQIDCTGTLTDMISFMHDINSSKDLLKIVKFNMTPKRGSPDEVNVSMTIVKLVIVKGKATQSSVR